MIVTDVKQIKHLITQSHSCTHTHTLTNDEYDDVDDDEVLVVVDDNDPVCKDNEMS